MPWAYFLFVTVGPMRSYDMSGNETIGPGGVVGFIEFEGVWGSLLIYAKSAFVCALVVFIVCSIYDLILNAYESKP